MNILNKLINITEEMSLNESGVRNMRTLAKDYKEAEIYYHMDLDGLTSAIGLKTYLRKYNIKTIAAHPIQYGDQEFSVAKPKPHTLHILVDFAHGKPIMHIHTDHHSDQVGFDKTKTSISFVKTPSNAAYISQVLSPGDLFPPEDAKIISTVDSADFASQGMTPDDVMRIVFKVDKSKSVSVNHAMMGYATNKLILAHKNKKNFLSNLVMQASASLQSIYNITVKLAKKEGYRPPEELEADQNSYIEKQEEKKIKDGKLSDIKNLKNGQSLMVGTTVVQYGGGYMGKGNLYDRYTPFKLNPEAVTYTIAWPLGLVQASFNPFIKNGNKFNIGTLVMDKVMPKFKSKMQAINVSLEYIKRTFEKTANTDSIGFTFNDLTALFADKVKGLSGSDKWQDMVKDITNKPYKQLSYKQKDILKKVNITLWDLVMAQSGGHPSIVNVSGLSFMGKGYVDFMKEIQTEIVRELQKV